MRGRIEPGLVLFQNLGVPFIAKLGDRAHANGLQDVIPGTKENPVNNPGILCANGNLEQQPGEEEGEKGVHLPEARQTRRAKIRSSLCEIVVRIFFINAQNLAGCSSCVFPVIPTFLPTE